jgi:nucleotide-binding universal stress UspA family protein
LQRPILIAYDGSPVAENSVRVAAALFPMLHARLLTVHAPPITFERVAGAGGRLAPAAIRSGVEELAREIVKAARTTAQEGVRLATDAGMAAEPLVAEACPRASDAILAAGDEQDAEVIIVGSRGRGGLTRSLLGSTSSSVLHHASRPVLVIPQGPEPLTGPVILAYDGSDAARAAVAAAGRLLRGRPVVVVHAWESAIRHTVSGRLLGGAPLEEVREIVGDFDAMYAREAQSTVEEGVRLAQEAGLEATGSALESDAGRSRVIAAAGDDREAAAIVTGSRGLGNVSSVLLGSVSSGLVHSADRPTLVVTSSSQNP